MHLSILSILFVFITTVCASSQRSLFSVDGVSAISKRAGESSSAFIAQQQVQDEHLSTELQSVPLQLRGLPKFAGSAKLLALWGKRTTSRFAGQTTEPVYRVRDNSGRKLLIKGFLKEGRSKLNLDWIESNIKLHNGLGDLVAWAMTPGHSSTDPLCMMVIEDKGYFSAKEMKLTQNMAIPVRDSTKDDIYKRFSIQLKQNLKDKSFVYWTVNGILKAHFV